MMAEEWGPWIDHDGKGCPVPYGTRVLCLWEDDVITEQCALMGMHGLPKSCTEHGSWDWQNRPRIKVIVAYRMHKPSGMIILQNLIADLPVPFLPEVDA